MDVHIYQHKCQCPRPGTADFVQTMRASSESLALVQELYTVNGEVRGFRTVCDFSRMLEENLQ